MSPQSMLLESLAKQRSAELGETMTQDRLRPRPSVVRRRAGRALISVGARLASVDAPATTLGKHAATS